MTHSSSFQPPYYQFELHLFVAQFSFPNSQQDRSIDLPISCPFVKPQTLYLLRACTCSRHTLIVETLSFTSVEDILADAYPELLDSTHPWVIYVQVIATPAVPTVVSRNGSAGRRLSRPVLTFARKSPQPTLRTCIPFDPFHPPLRPDCCRRASSVSVLLPSNRI